MLAEADTCGSNVVPKLLGAGWDNDPHSIAEQRFFTDGRIFRHTDQALFGKVHEDPGPTPALYWKMLRTLQKPEFMSLAKEAIAAIADITDYSVAFIKESPGKPAEVVLAGSGTLVSVGNVKAILTAHQLFPIRG